MNSALQRARQGVGRRVPARSQQAELTALGPDGRRELVDSLVTAWENADVAALVSLLADDARFTMPPLPAWFDGKADVTRFFTERVFAARWRVVPLEVNAQLGIACYTREPGADAFVLGAINVISLRAGRISQLTGFLDPETHRRFGLPAEIDPENIRGNR
ncbi:MAG TPA: nuclear transport factor 2 family protein [Jiangellaceae bacterium]